MWRSCGRGGSAKKEDDGELIRLRSISGGFEGEKGGTKGLKRNGCARDRTGTRIPERSHLPTKTLPIL